MTRNPNRLDDVKQGGDRCPDCGKVRYLTRRHAKQIARRISARRSGRLNAYRCGEFWHIGHLPNAVRHRDLARDEIDTRRTG
jgi:hypothetical protein